MGRGLRRSLVAAVGALALAVPISTPAVAGYDIAHAVQRTCDPGGPLVFSRSYSNELTRVPGRVVGCPPGVLDRRLQIGVGPERIGNEDYLCTYYSHMGGAGRDTCWIEGSLPRVFALQAVAIDGSTDKLAIVGAADRSIRRIDLAPTELFRAARRTDPVRRVPGPGGFDYFVIAAPQWEVCVNPEPRLLARDREGRIVATERLDRDIPVMDGQRGVSIKGFCGIEMRVGEGELDPLTRVGMALML